MSAVLEFYLASWADLAAAIGSGDRRLFSAALKKSEPDVEELYDADDYEGGPDFEEGLERWVEGRVPATPGAVARVSSLGDALGFVALIRHFGRPLGTMQHSSEAGDPFRDEFLAKVAQRELAAPVPLLGLTSRPILGYESADFPFWGGLRAGELAQLAPALARPAPEYPADESIDQWLAELWDVLGAAVEAETDLITLYS